MKQIPVNKCFYASSNLQTAVHRKAGSLNLEQRTMILFIWHPQAGARETRNTLVQDRGKYRSLPKCGAGVAML